MNKASPIRFFAVFLSIALSLWALYPKKSVEVQVSGNSSASLKLSETFPGWRTQTFQLTPSGNGTVGETPGLTATLSDGHGTILKSGINIGAGYAASTALDVGEGNPTMSLSKGEIGQGVVYNITRNVDYLELGLDLVGGSEIIYQVSKDSLAMSSDGTSNIGSIVSIFQKKLNNSGMKEIFVQSIGTDRIAVQLPGLRKAEIERIKSVLERQGKLEFKIVIDDAELMEKARKLEAQGKKLSGYDIAYKITRHPDGTMQKDESSAVLVTSRAMVTGADISSATLHRDQQSLKAAYAVSVDFTGVGQKKFGKLTEENIGKPLAIILDDSLVSAPRINGAIFGTCEITGDFTEDEAKDLVTVLRSGSMDAKLTLYTENMVGPTLGSDSIASGVQACLVGSLLVFLLVFYYYRAKLGGVANLTLVLNILLLLGTMAAFGATLTLPGIAGLALTIGMAVDATVLIYERMREESVNKQHIKITLTKAFDRAFITIFDSNFTTFITAAVLFMIGNSAPVKGFCATLMLGLVINMFCAVFVTQTILTWAVNRGTLKDFGLAPLGAITNFDFLKNGKFFRLASYLLMFVGILAIANKGMNFLDVEFNGGNLLQVQLKEPVSADRVREVCKDLGYPAAIVQSIGLGNNKTSYTIRTVELTPQANKDFQAGLRKLPLADGDSAFPLNYTIGASAATEMLVYAFMALIASLIIILFYIMVRFTEFKYGVATCLAVSHDVVITLGLLAMLDLKINLTIFAGILTIIGYSINDTIVIFDRIRENIGGLKNYDFAKQANLSLNQTLSRTLRTGMTTLLVISAMMFLGGGVITGFAVTMFIGIVVGTFSSLFIAAPFVHFLHNRDPHGDGAKEAETTTAPATTTV